MLTALLVYFGWVRSEVLARNLGIDESLLGMSTREYMLRSVRPVLVLLIVVAASALLWVAFDHWLTRRWSRVGPDDRLYRWVLRLMPLSILILPSCAVALRIRFPVFAYISFPLLCAAGLLLLLYALHLRSQLPAAVTLSPRRESLVRLCAATLVGVSLFSAAANYATYEGNQLAQAFNQRLAFLPEVVVHSTTPLNIDVPGVRTGRGDEESGYRYRYEGLRLLEKTGGQYFLISDTWTPEYGTVIALKDNDPGLRYEFIRDIRG
ncbi:hypothetical protein ACFYE2_06970 [Kocuria sp. CPCC 205300]|uniref:hypothetical protein n=1 Tax=Kocuria sabuli TaxID=3071448 RepID=UPI0036D83E70